MAASLQDRRIEQDVMLQQIEEVLRYGQPEDPPAYTLILGAGASFGTVPTAKQMLGIPDKGVIHEDSIPVFLHERAHREKPKPEDLPRLVQEFWGRFAKKNGDLLRAPTTGGEPKLAPITLDSAGYPDNRSVAEAYKAIFDQRRTAGINTPAGAREYLRTITLKRRGEPTRLNGTHFFLASLLSLQRRAQEVDEKGELYYVGRRDFARTIFTTNFDPLLQVSLQLFQLLYYMTDRPELLAADGLHTDDHPALHLFYAHGSVHRPFLANTDDEITHLHANARDLAGYLGRHGVIVLGYSGWDDCLLRAMQQTSSFANNLYWLARGENSLSPEVQKFLCSRPNAYWVPISDGGVFMECLHRTLCPALPYTELLQNPIPFVQRRLERVQLSDIVPVAISVPAGSSTEENTRPGDAVEQFPSPEQFRVQVVELLRYSAQHFAGLAPNSEPQRLLAQLLHRADMAYAEKQWNNAAQLYKQVIDQGTALPEKLALAFFRRGSCYVQGGKTSEAIADYTRAIDLPGVPADTLAKALLNRGYHYLQQGKTAAAIADYTRIIGLPGLPTDRLAKALFNRAFCYGEQGTAPEAIADYTRAIDLRGAPAHTVAGALLNRGTIYKERGKAAEAIADYTRAIDLPDVPADRLAMGLFNRGTIYKEQGKAAEAIADYTRAIDLPDVPAGTLAGALINRGNRYKEQSKNAEAIADFTRAIDLPGLPADVVARALFNRGNSYNEQGKNAEAIADFTRSIDLPGLPADVVARSLLNRGNSYREQGKAAEAIADYTRAIDLPDAPADVVTRAREIMAGEQNTSGQNNTSSKPGEEIEVIPKWEVPRTARSRKASKPDPTSDKPVLTKNGKVPTKKPRSTQSERKPNR